MEIDEKDRRRERETNKPAQNDKKEQDRAVEFAASEVELPELNVARRVMAARRGKSNNARRMQNDGKLG